jgi:hypothetical protein
MDDAHHLEAMSLQARHDQIRITARIDDDGFFRQWVTDNRAVALQRPDGEGFTD